MIKKLLKNKNLLMVLAVAWTILIFIGCSLPGKDLPAITVFDQFDKVVHFVFFFVFAILWLIVIHNLTNGHKKRKQAWRAITSIVYISFLYGFALEYYQINFVPGRSWDVWDGVADGVGGIFGSLVFYFQMKLN